MLHVLCVFGADSPRDGRPSVRQSIQPVVHAVNQDKIVARPDEFGEGYLRSVHEISVVGMTS